MPHRRIALPEAVTREGDGASRLYERLGDTLAGVTPEYALSSAGTRDGSAFYFKRSG